MGQIFSAAGFGSGGRKMESKRDAPRPGCGQRFFDHAQPVIGVNEAVG
jgi:hypothetical protein